jgi:hypothetical protein
MPLADKAKLADHVIDNSGAEAETMRQADDVLREICKEKGLDPARYGL